MPTHKKCAKIDTNFIRGTFMKKDLTRGSITAALCSFAAPMILGNLLQQAYNLGDTLVIGRCLGDNALAAACSRARFSASHAYVFRRLRAAVGHEFRHFDDTGAGQQFRHARYFGIRHLARRRRCRHMVVYPDRLVFGRYCRRGDNAAQSENHRRYIITQKKRRRSKKVPAHFFI